MNNLSFHFEYQDGFGPGGNRDKYNEIEQGCKTHFDMPSQAVISHADTKLFNEFGFSQNSTMHTTSLPIVC